MSGSSPSSSGAPLARATALALAAGAFFIAMVAVGIVLANNIGGSNASQTPVVADEAQVTIEIRNFDYFPQDLTVRAGTQVTWVNSDTVPHTATDEAEGWDTGTLNEGQSATLTFDTPGTYEYFCTIHPSMKATLTVR